QLCQSFSHHLPRRLHDWTSQRARATTFPKFFNLHNNLIQYNNQASHSPRFFSRESGENHLPSDTKREGRDRKFSACPVTTMAAPPTPTLVLLPEWGAGHLMSMLESCKRLLLRGGRAFSITLLVMR
uniref:Uncharacterized protein n=1 Tax=Triticum urartu TaxID=4572 RepID=A0A8R7VDV1_TRIUA